LSPTRSGRCTLKEPPGRKEVSDSMTDEQVQAALEELMASVDSDQEVDLEAEVEIAQRALTW
jgi:hypothetical protein